METLENKIIRVLLIEDNAGDARLIQEQLKEVSDITYRLECVSQLQEGLDYLSRHETDIVLSDLSLPDSPGLETFRRLQNEVSTVPVVVLTGFDNKSVALQAVRDGAQDFLIKGQVEGKTLSRLILYAIERYHTQGDLRNLSLTDAMTELHNRRGFITLGEQALKTAHRNKTPLCLFFADLDGLKQINDTYGHKEGDQAIIYTAQILRKTFRESDILARLGGDEFVILSTPDPHSQPEHLIARLHKNLEQFTLEKKLPYALSLSVGAAQFNPAKLSTIEELLAEADRTLYTEKKERKGLKALPTAKSKTTRYRLEVTILAVLLLVFARRYWFTHRTVVVPSPVQTSSNVQTLPLPSKPLVRDIAPQKPLTSHGEIHQELIPKDIEIVRFYYEHPIVLPGTTFGFDMNGLGFTPAFQKSLSVSAGTPGVGSKSLRLITANQIHGDMVVPPDAATQYVFPRVLLNHRPVFQAPQPFAVIRLGEVLDIVFTSMDEDGRGGRFRIFTNLTPEMARNFHIKTNSSGLDISALKAHPPYVIEGSLHLVEGVDHGDYDLIAFLGSKEIFRKRRMLRVVRPNVGQTGLVQGLTAAEENHRPGDNVELLFEGTGFAPQDIESLTARVEEIDMGKMSFNFISPTRLGIYLTIPKDIPEGSYGILIEQNRRLLWRQKKVFTVVPANWAAAFQMTPTGPGERGVLKLTGRDFSEEFARSLRVQSDDPGIHISGWRRTDASTLSANIEIDTSVTPGDYLLELTSKGVPIKPPGGSLITINTE